MSLAVVCVCVGDKYDEVYINRLANMVKRNLSVPHTFICFTDRTRKLNPDIIQRDAKDWGVSGWFNKLKLFDRKVLDQEFLFLDLALVITNSMDPLADYAKSSSACLIGMRDWNYDCFGSMTMWVRPCEQTQGIWNAYAGGQRFPTKTEVDGDQDFIDAYIDDSQMTHLVDYFPQQWFVSYKALRKMHRKQPEQTAKELKESIFLKFHGPPKMHELMDNFAHAKILLEQKPLRFFQWWSYLRKETSTWWQ